MKLLFAVLVYLILDLILGCGLLLAAKGSGWFLVAGIMAYTIAFTKIGCLPGKTH